MSDVTKKRMIISFVILVIGVILSIFISTIIHNILSSRQLSLYIPNIKECIQSLLNSKQHFKLFLVFIAIVVLGSTTLLISNDKGYKSDLQKITPNIYTPVRAGQNQYGSARWMTEKEKDKYFKSMVLNPKNSKIKELIETGYDDLI